MLLRIKTIKHKKGIYENKPYDNYEVLGFVVNDTNSSVICGEDFLICKFSSEVFEKSLDRNLKALNKPELNNSHALEGIYMVPVFGTQGIQGKCEDLFLSLPDTYAAASDTFPNENVAEKTEKSADKKK